MKKHKHKIVIKSGKTCKKTQKITRKNKKKTRNYSSKSWKKHFFDDVFQENSNPKTIWIQELTPESALDPGTDSWKPCRSRSWLLKTMWIQESAPGSEGFSGVSSWIQSAFRSQLLDPHGFQESAPGSTGFSGVSSWIQSAFRSQFLDPNGFWVWIFLKNIIKKMFFSRFWWIISCFFLVCSCYFLCLFACFSRFYYDFVFVFFHLLMVFFCFLGVFDSFFVNLIQVEATCIRKNTKQYPKWKYCMAFSWLPMMLKIERVKSWTQDMDPETRPCSTSDFLILEHLGMTCK